MVEALVVKLVNYMMTMREKEIDIERERDREWWFCFVTILVGPFKM
jgi:hypothetical protein